MKKKDNIFVNIIVFILVILVTYYAFVMPEDLPVHSQMACEELSQFFGDLAE